MATEKRLIDANDMKTAFREWFDHDDYRTMNELIDDVPTVDAVEVVRCKDCKRYVEGHCLRELGGGSYVPFPMKPDDFCSYGERREGE